ncbi:MAG: hypothetical protein KBG84_01310 [Planctomycetes bacterium]|nr:hypothetical protein [Planctomycetota bacterium]
MAHSRFKSLALASAAFALLVLTANGASAVRGVDEMQTGFFDFSVPPLFITVELEDLGVANPSIQDDVSAPLPDNEGGYSGWFTEVEAENTLDMSAHLEIALGITQGANVSGGRGEQYAANESDDSDVEIQNDCSIHGGEGSWKVLLVQRVWHQVYVHYDPGVANQAATFDCNVESRDIYGDYRTTRIAGAWAAGNVTVNATAMRYNSATGQDSGQPIEVGVQTEDFDTQQWDSRPEETADSGAWQDTFSGDAGFSVRAEAWYESTVLGEYESAAMPEDDAYGFEVYGAWDIQLEDMTQPAVALDPSKRSTLDVFLLYGNYIFVWEVVLTRNFDGNTVGCPSTKYQDHSNGQPDTP